MPCDIKLPPLTKKTLMAIRRRNTMRSNATFGIGGLPRKSKPPPINLRLPKEKK